MDDTYKILELEEIKNNVKNGEYIDLSDKLLNKNQNYILEVDNLPIGFFIHDIGLNNIDEDFFKFISSIKEVSNNRGDISGIIDLERIEPKQKERILKGEITKFNKNNTRSKRTENYKYEFCNIINSFIFNNRNKRSEKYKKEIKSHFQPICTKLHKWCNHFYNIPKEKIYLNSFFSDIIVNKGLRSAVHKDANNDLKMGCVMVFSENNKLDYSNLNLPDLNISIPFKSNKSALFIDLVNIRHSNDPIEEELLKYRISVIFYNRLKYRNEKKDNKASS